MSVRAWLGIAVQGFPEFEQFCIAGFPASTQVLLKSAAYAIPPRPRAATSLMIGHLARFYTSFPGQPVPLESAKTVACSHRKTRRQAVPDRVKDSWSRYPEEPEGLLSLDPQLVCYSWITGIAKVAQVVFVRKNLVEVQYLRTTMSDEQRQEFGNFVENTIRRIESADFPPHSGIRFPQNPCSSCPYVGLCLGKQELIDAAVVRRPGAESLGWLDELNY